MKKTKIAGKKYEYKAVYVEWLDSCMRKQVWWGGKDLIEETKKPRDKFQTVSYLVNQNKHEYVFASSVHFEDGEAVSLGQIFTIPKGCVTKLKLLEI